MKSASTTICGGEQRVRNIYMSDTHEIHVEIVPTHNDDKSAEFLLKYQGTFAWDGVLSVTAARGESCL